MEIEEKDIDFKALFLNILQYKWMILICIALFGIGSSYYAYSIPNVYRATASVKVGLDEDQYAKDVISMAMGKGAVNASTEKDIITSMYLSEKALEAVDFTHHYYAKTELKEIELYKQSPFKVFLTEGYGISFYLYPIDKEHYRLLVHTQLGNDGTSWEYDQIHIYGETVTTNHFTLSILLENNPKYEEYRFIIDKKRKAFGSVSVSQHLENSTILQISVEDTVALRAEEYANALAKAYVKQNVENKSREAVQRISFIDDQLKNIKEKIKKSANALETFRKESRIVSVSNQTEVIETRLGEYESELMDLNMKEAMLNDFYGKIKSKIKIETLSTVGIEEKDSTLEKLMVTLQDTVLETRLLLEDYTYQHPAVIKNNRKISQLKRTIIHMVENLLQNVKKKKTLLVNNIKKQKTFLNTLPENARKYGQLKRRFEMNEELYSYLMKQKSEAEMVKASTVSKNRLLDKASIPRSPIKPKRRIIIAMGVFLGFILGVLLAFLRILMDSKIKTESDITAKVSYPIVASIPHFNKMEDGWKGKVPVFDATKSALAESFRHLRSNIQFMRQKEGAQILLVTSTVGQEGKTTVSVNLGAIMSLANKRTIIINLDMRKPTLHERFDLPNQLGLSELLNKRCSLGEVIQKTRYPGLDILSSGAIPPNPSELIQSVKMYDLLNELTQMYEMIILDTPPIGLVTDAKELMHYADINLFVVRAGYSKKEFLDHMKKFDIVEKTPHIGIILNDIPMKKGRYGYYSDYGYYEEVPNKNKKMKN